MLPPTRISPWTWLDDLKYSSNCETDLYLSKLMSQQGERIAMLVAKNVRCWLCKYSSTWLSSTPKNGLSSALLRLAKHLSLRWHAWATNMSVDTPGYPAACCHACGQNARGMQGHATSRPCGRSIQGHTTSRPCGRTKVNGFLCPMIVVAYVYFIISEALHPYHPLLYPLGAGTSTAREFCS